MSADDESDGSRRSNRRVTLRWESPLLSLPGEALSTQVDAGLVPLALPRSTGEPVEPSREAGPPEPADDEPLDAWERQRPRLATPPPFRPPAIHPPAIHPPAIHPAGDIHPPGDARRGDAIDLVDRRARPLPTDPAVEMSERYALGDYTAALRAAELILGRDPGHALAREVAAGSQKQLERLLLARLGPMDQVPRLAVDASTVRWLGLDSRAGFILSRIDGWYTVAEILDISGMPTLEVLRIIVELLDAGAIVLTSRRA